MGWPALSDYQEAVQTPAHSFGDPELRKAVADMDRLGLPRAMSGNFAVVFPVHNGSARWAVRCFSTFHADYEARYRAISHHLQAHPLSWMVRFQYQAQGIRTRGAWYPILKMEWVEGELLNRYVERHLGKPEVLVRLTQQFVHLVADLERNGIAHGDLQHANLIVAGGRLRLIDYDGMYVPGLSGMGSHELGHLNYQHPQRSHQDFGPYVDNFSAWVIYLSLLALSIDPNLWGMADAGDEYLLFRQRDFSAPHASHTVRALQTSGDHALNGIASFLIALAEKPLPTVPRLRLDSMQPVAAAAARAGTALPDWLEPPSARPPASGNGRAAAPAPQPVAAANAAARSTRPGGVTMQRPSPAPLPGWLHHRSLSPARVDYQVHRSAGQAIVAMWALTIPLMVFMAVLGAAMPLVSASVVLATAALALAALAVTYGTSPPFREKMGLQARIRRQRGRQRWLERRLTRLGEREQRLRERRDRALAQALERRQEEFLANELSRYPVFVAPIPGIGLMLRARLFAAGYRTAADIGPQVRRLPGIGPARAAALLAWRNECEARVLRHMPHSLSPSERAAIKGRYAPELRVVQDELSKKRREHHDNGLALRQCEQELADYVEVNLRHYLNQVLSLRS